MIAFFVVRPVMHYLVKHFSQIDYFPYKSDFHLDASSDNSMHYDVLVNSLAISIFYRQINQFLWNTGYRAYLADYTLANTSVQRFNTMSPIWIIKYQSDTVFIKQTPN